MVARKPSGMPAGRATPEGHMSRRRWRPLPSHAPCRSVPRKIGTLEFLTVVGPGLDPTSGSRIQERSDLGMYST
jgi:hypothetical protein